MSQPGGYSYRPNVNRAVTQKWKEAAQANYGGDDWGDDDDDGEDYDEPEPQSAPVSASNPRHPAWGARGQIPPSNRSVTNPSPSRSGGRASFDRGDDRRNFSAGAGGFDSAYPTTQRPPFPEPQHDGQPQAQNFRPQPPQLYTQGPSPYLPSGIRPGSRGQQQSPYDQGPFSAPGGYPHRRSESGNRTGAPDQYQQHGSPIRPDSRASNQSGNIRPPRKSSLSQQQPPTDIPLTGSSAEPEQSESNNPPSAKALPFIRPADIYKRVEEERERERRSQDSSRPSIDLSQNRTRDSSTSARSSNEEVKEQPASASEDTESSRRLKPTLDTVMERKSEYGFDNILQNATATHPSVAGAVGVQRHPTDASSVYTDRPDPVSASTMSRNESLREDRSVADPASAHSQTRHYQLPSIGRIPSWGNDALLTGKTNPDQAPTSQVPYTAPPVPTKDDGNARAQTASDNSGPLGHKPSLGYTSMVHQAFDESQTREVQSPTSVDNSVLRSNSASTADISPIIGGRQEPAVGLSGPSVIQQTIPEETTTHHTRSTSEATVKAQEKDLPEPPRIRPGYRRDNTPPSRDNSPAKKPTVQTGSPLEPTQGMLRSTTQQRSDFEDQESSAGPEVRGRITRPLAATPAAPASASIVSSTNLQPHLDARSTSEEYLQWQAEGKSFKERVGIQDSNPTTPSAASYTSRTQSPGKGMVRQMTDKLESNSGRSTPVKDTMAEPWSATETRPQAQPRMESFRPALPGGWQSYTGTTGAPTPGQETPQPLRPTQLKMQGKTDSTDSIPTAKPPQDFGHGYGPSKGAFAAAAAAGTALAGAFAAGKLSHQDPAESPESSENECDQSSTSSKAGNEVSEARDFATFSAAPPVSNQESSLPPTPLPKDTPTTSVPPVQNDTASEAQEQSTSDYFPAPLRTSRSIEPSGIMRPPIPTVSTTEESPVHPDNEQLQQDIVKSLTPKSSNFEAQSDAPATEKSLPMSPPHEANTAQFSSAVDEDDMYGGGTPQQIHSAEQSSAKAFPSQQAISSTGFQGSDLPHRPILDQRFSWEMDSDGQNVPPPVSKTIDPRVGTAVNPNVSHRDERSIDDEEDGELEPESESATNLGETTTDRFRLSTDEPVSRPGDFRSSLTEERDQGTPTPTSAQPPTPTKSTQSASAGPTSMEKSFRHIMKIDNQQQRILAFNENRGVFDKSDGVLDQWLRSMQTPEHADLFQSSGRPQPAAASTGNTPNRPSPRPMASMSGTKVMKEDGKRLMAAAGTFGGKTGKAAKGLFSKGKDKLRAASAGDKGLFATRRKSNGSDIPESAQPQESKRSSLLLSVPPQIPAQNLEYSPIDTDEWALPSERSQEDLTTSRQPQSEEADHWFEKKDGLTPVTIDEGEEDASSVGQEDEVQPRGIEASAAPHVLVSQPDEVVNSEDRTSEAAVLEEQRSPQVRAVAQERKEEHAADLASLKAQRPPRAETPAGEARDELIAETASEQEERALLMDAVAEAKATRLEEPTETEHSEMARATQNLPSDEAGLAVPADRQPSVISVSSASPSPAPSQEAETNARRSISPDDQHRAASERTQSYQPFPTKEEEAMKDRNAAAKEDDPVPSYDEGPSKRQSRIPRIEPDAQIVHVADLSHQKRQEISRQSRPFSFEGSETINRALQQQISAPDANDSTQPFSPVSQALSKEMSQVSVEEVDDGQNDANKRHSRSYSRPFGADPIKDHPALRQPDSAIDRSQMYSTESPLPSARRSQQELERLRTNSPPVQQPIEEEENYRIPGPYHMEYRSPRRSSPSPQSAFPPAQVRQSPLSQNPPAISPQPNTYQRQAQSPEPQQPVPVPAPVSAPAVRPGSARGKQRSFVGIFRNRSQSRSRRGKQSDTDGSAIRRSDTRDDSLHSHQSESRDVVGQLPTDKKQRRFSRDPARSSTPTEGEPRDSKKKRFSAMGNLFARASKSQKPASPKRASTLPLNATHPTKQPPQNYQEQEQVYSAALNRAYSGKVIQQFSGTPPPAGGYYGPAGQEGYFTEPPTGESARYHRMSTQDPVYSQVSQTPDYDTYQQPSQRPTNLHIDTSGNQPRNNSGPATAPPHTYAPRDISYQSRVYNPVSTRGPQSATPGQPNSHVVDLHKRSRSPKLGRYSPDDEQVERARSPQNENLGLGTFSNKKLSPAGGVPRPSEDQEAPYRITLPGDSEQEKRRTRQLMIEQGQVKDVSSVASTAGSSGPTKTVAERMAGPQLPGSDAPSGNVAVRAPLHERPNGSVNQKGYVAELPGSKANGYESEEEIPMSATAGPGQWSDPLFLGEWRDD